MFSDLNQFSVLVLLSGPFRLFDFFSKILCIFFDAGDEKRQSAGRENRISSPVRIVAVAGDETNAPPGGNRKGVGT